MTTGGELDGRVAIVTGSSSGIGAETARRLAALGASVIVNSASSIAAGEAVDEIFRRTFDVNVFGTRHAVDGGLGRPPRRHRPDVPAHRSATPEHCAEAVLALVRNTYVTGHVFLVDGGSSLVF